MSEDPNQDRGYYQYQQMLNRNRTAASVCARASCYRAVAKMPGCKLSTGVQHCYYEQNRFYLELPSLLWENDLLWSQVRALRMLC